MYILILNNLDILDMPLLCSGPDVPCSRLEWCRGLIRKEATEKMSSQEGGGLRGRG